MAIFRGNLRNPAKTNEGACAILYYKEIFPKYEKSNDILQKGMKKTQFAAYLGHHRGVYNCCFYINCKLWRWAYTKKVYQCLFLIYINIWTTIMKYHRLQNLNFCFSSVHSVSFCRHLDGPRNAEFSTLCWTTLLGSCNQGLPCIN